MEDLSKNFEKFIEKIELTDNQIEDGENKADNICKTLHKHYYDSAYDGSTKLIIGSFGKNTAIRPPSDVDVIFELPPSEKERYDNRSGNGQSQLLQYVKEILIKSYSLTNIKGDGPVVVVDFDTYKIEVNPSFKEIYGYDVPITKDGGKWERIHPIKEKEEIDKSDERSNGNTKNLIKMIKRWKSWWDVPLKSFHIELLVTDFLKENEHYNGDFSWYPFILNDFFEFLLNSKNKIRLIPGTTKLINYGDEWESKAKIAKKCSLNAIIADTKEESVECLQYIFGYLFPTD